MFHRCADSGAPRARRRPRASPRLAAQNVVEYGVLIGTIALVVLLGPLAFGQQISPWVAMLAGHITTTGT